MITEDDVVKAAAITHIEYTIEAIRNYRRMTVRWPFTEDRKVVKYLKKLQKQIREDFHTQAQRDHWNSNFPIDETNNGDLDQI